MYFLVSDLVSYTSRFHVLKSATANGVCVCVCVCVCSMQLFLRVTSELIKWASAESRITDKPFKSPVAIPSA